MPRSKRSGIIRIFLAHKAGSIVSFQLMCQVGKWWNSRVQGGLVSMAVVKSTYHRHPSCDFSQPLIEFTGFPCRGQLHRQHKSCEAPRAETKVGGGSILVHPVPKDAVLFDGFGFPWYLVSWSHRCCSGCWQNGLQKSQRYTFLD